MRLLTVALCSLAVGCGGHVSRTLAVEGGADAGADGQSDASMADGQSDANMTDAGALADAGNICKPLPGCTSETTCPATDGCNTCTCEQGVWECTGYACPPDGGNVGCDNQISSENGTPCTIESQVCIYPLAPAFRCREFRCVCDYLVWFCGQYECGDAGIDYGDADGGNIVNYVCPDTQPSEGSACSVDSAFCEYGDCPTNCLCSNGLWDCAAPAGCVD